jgi:hypothetical protein
MQPPGDYAWVQPMAYINFILPISELGYCMEIYIALASGMFIFKWAVKFADWVADVIP